MQHIIPAFTLAAVLAIVHYFGEEIDEQTRPVRPAIASAAAGVTSAYIFLQLMPELYDSVTHIGDSAFIFALLGFTVLHVTEKYIYHHEKDLNDLRQDFKELHSVFLFLYHGFLGIIITELLSRNLLTGVLFYVPILLHTAISSLAIKELHEDILDVESVKMLVAGSGLLGVTAAWLLPVTTAVFHTGIGLITGMFLYIVVRDTLRPSSRGEPWSFLGGAFLYSAIIIYLWQFI